MLGICAGLASTGAFMYYGSTSVPELRDIQLLGAIAIVVVGLCVAVATDILMRLMDL